MSGDLQGRPIGGVIVASDREFLGGLLDWEAATDEAGRTWYRTRRPSAM